MQSNGEDGLVLAPMGKARRRPRVAAWRVRLQRLAAFGIDGYPPDVQRRLKILNVVAYLIAFFTIAYAVQHLFADRRAWAPVIAINVVLATIALLVPFAHRISDTAGGLIIAVAEYIALFALTAYLGHSSGIQMQYVVGAAAPFAIFGLKRARLAIAVVVIGMLLHLAAWFLLADERALIQISDFDRNALYVTAALTTFGLIAATVYYAFHLAERAQAETDQLLRNILPDMIADRLKAQPGVTIADSFEQASVLFADLKGFVSLAKTLGPARTVEFLNRLMTRFDELADHHGVEKIKTIGDAYMVAAGIPTPAPDHAQRIARLGIDLLAAVDQAGTDAGSPLAMRIGIASGPVMAGVIGAKRLTYDVWGDTVNLAARLENRGEPGRLHVSEQTRLLLEDTFVLERRGPLDLKGFGVEQTWYLVGPKCGAADGQQSGIESVHRDLTPSAP